MSEMFSEDEELILSKTMRLRERMIDNVAKVKDEELPRKPSDIMAVTTLMESMDRSVLSKAKLRLEEKAEKNQSTSRQVLLDLMAELHHSKAATPTPSASDAPAPQYAPQEHLQVSAGELIAKTDNCHSYE